MFNFKRVIGKIYFSFAAWVLKVISVIIFIIYGLSSLTDYVNNKSMHYIIVDHSQFRLDGICKLNVLYYRYGESLSLAKDTNNNVIWCERIGVTYDDLKNAQWR